MEYKYVGKNILRDDVIEKAKGSAKYVCDMKRQDMLYAKVFLSTKACAEFEIDTSLALMVPGIKAIYTFKDVPKVKYNSHKWYAGIDIFEDEYILSDKARFVGDKIALIVGETMESIKRAMKEIKVTYFEKSCVLTIDEAKENKTLVQEDLGTNLAFEKELSCGDSKSVLENSSLVIEDTGSTPKVHHGAIEPHICLSEFDYSGNLVVWTPCQVAFQVQTLISQILNIPYSKIRVIKALMGGSFGGKGQPVLEPVCAFAALMLNRPIKLVMDRKDAVLATRTRNRSRINVKTAVDDEGYIKGREINLEIDAGAYYTNASAVIMSIGKKAFRLYDIKEQTIYGRSYLTNTAIGGACRGYGSPQLHAITEINIDQCAKALNMDPCEFRLKNLVKEGMKDPCKGPDLGNAKARDCVLKGMEAFNWKERRENIKKKDTDRYAYGVGMAAGVHGNGYKGSYPDFTDVNVKIYPDGSILIKSGIHEQGCGTILTLKQIAAESLNVSTDKIDLVEADTFLTPYDSAGTQASRVTFVSGGAIKKACDKLCDKIIESIMVLKNVDKDKIILKDGKAFVNEESYSYGEVAVMVERDLRMDLSVDVHYESPANPGTYAASFAEVKIDKYTGHVDVISLLCVHDIGRAIHPILAEGQVQGGAHFSIGMALREEIVYDKNGNVKNTNFSKYHMLNAVEMPEVKVIFIEDHEPFGPYGAKSVGEMAAVCPGPAVVNAINHALNTRITNYPVTPEVIIENLYK